MNTRVNQDTAEQVVRESLGMSAEDLGMNPLPGGIEDEDTDDGGLDDNDNEQSGQQEESFQPQAREEPQYEDFSTPQPQQREQQRQMPSRAEVRTDGKGNLVDAKTGQIVARAGVEARMYQNLHKTRAEVERSRGEIADTRQRLEKAVTIGTELHDNLTKARERLSSYEKMHEGLSESQVRQAVGFARQAQTDPVGTLKTLLTRAAADGIDLSQIGLAGGNFDPKAFMQIVRDELKTGLNPLHERSAEEKRQREAEAESNQRAEAAKGELNTFLSQNPGAKEYLPIFQKVYENPNFQHMTLGEVWSRLQLNLMRRGQQPSSQQRPANPRQVQNRRMPTGRPVPNRGPEREPIASVDASYEDIVRGILK